MRFWLFLLLSLWPATRCLAAQRVPATAAPPALLLRDTTQTYQLSPLLELLPDPPGAPLSLAQVLSAPYASRFRRSPELIPNTAGSHTYWVRWQLGNALDTRTQWVLSMRAFLTSFDLFTVDKRGRVVRAQHLDPDYTWAALHALPGRRFNIALTLPSGQLRTFYLHSAGSIYNFQICERTQLLQLFREGDVWETLFFGTFLVLVVYNLLLFLAIRDRTYLYYVLYASSFALLQAQATGYLRQWLAPILAAPALTSQHIDLLEGLLLGATLFTGILTVRSFLETGRLAPRLDRALRVVAYFTPLPLLAAFVPYDWSGWLAPLVALAVSAALLAAGIAVTLTGYRPARYYMAGWTLVLLAVIAFYLRTLRLLPVSFFTEYGIRVTSALDVILLSLGLADRINVARRERQLAQEATIAALREKDDVREQATRELTRHAAQLQHAYQELQTSLQTTDKLQSLDELKTRFFTNISHELRTPLTLILAPLEQLVADTRADHPAAAEYELMHHQARRLLQLVNQLLDVARLEAGQLRLRAVPTDLHRFVRTHTAAFSSLAASRGLHLLIEADGPAVEAWVEPDQLEKILGNLLSNALKFTPASGTVRVRLYADGQEAVLQVQDTGPGIAPGHLGRIFERFQQADDSLTRPYGGSGVGLALVKELVQLHQGQVRVQSTLGQGTTFEVRLRLGCAHLTPEQMAQPTAAEVPATTALAERPGPTERSARTAADTSGSRPLVLIVEDHPDMRQYLRTCLAADYRVLLAPDGPAGLAAAHTHNPDLVVSDLMMPGLDGLGLCERLKADEATSHIPVVLLTARTTDESRLAGLELGADDYLTKPFRPVELRARVRNLIQQRQLLRRRFGQEMTLQPRDIAITSVDAHFLTRALEVVEAHLADPDFSVDQFADALHLSRMQLHRKLKALADQPATEFIRTVRLRRAAQLLAATAGNVGEVCYQVGFQHLSYFTKCFRELYGYPPSEHAARQAALTE
ncbi:7TM diverse intracellular signaling domain-containing protein [Hymenobacter baengnokdamensis]|uniref:7TM diverse intracellular signaling domain-containing protein n=1 Tax=Hymenobacter baengnokdamensis TaxID=2615203 RepID=UPI0012481184|nr:7TM diverse intracellular signaling domain-containing protein [Hymenobacter baengnokdamensis]